MSPEELLDAIRSDDKGRRGKAYGQVRHAQLNAAYESLVPHFRSILIKGSAQDADAKAHAPSLGVGDAHAISREVVLALGFIGTESATDALVDGLKVCRSCSCD